MRHIRVTVIAVAILSTFLTALIYWMHQYDYDWNKFIATPEPEPEYNPYIPSDITEDSPEFDETFFQAQSCIDTKGCYIPYLPMNYTIGRKPDRIDPCGRRAVFLTRIKHTQYARVAIDTGAMNTYLPNTLFRRFQCCYQYIANDKLTSENNPCRSVGTGDKIFLEHDFLKIQCETDKMVYEDYYVFAKFKKRVTKMNRGSKKFNVLMIGMKSMSSNRFAQTMPFTHFYMSQSLNLYLSFQGYHKLDDKALTNLVAAYTGYDLPTLESQCTNNTEVCEDLFIWNQYKNSGYATAYAEDFIKLHDTFTYDYKFQEPRTDHYMKPFFQEVEERTSDGMLCSGKLTSAQQMLAYASDFATEYKDHNFFGVFMVNSYSYDEQHDVPHSADLEFRSFLQNITANGVLSNTFLILFSDHGIQFGDMRLNMEAYYEDRLPMLYIWVPPEFKKRYTQEYRYIYDNQNKLITPFDLHKTLLEIHQLSFRETNATVENMCKLCMSLLNDEILNDRVCSDVRINDKWCGCHKMYYLSVEDPEARRIMDFVLGEMNTKVMNTKLNRCWECVNRSLHKFLRIHYYYEGAIRGVLKQFRKESDKFFVVAFTMTFGYMGYEATVKRLAGGDLQLVEPINLISAHEWALGYCTNDPIERHFCICTREPNCYD